MFLQKRGQALELFLIENTRRVTKGRLGVIEKIAGLFHAKIVVNYGGQILYGVAGVRKQETIQIITLTLKDKLQSQFDHRADIRLQMRISARYFQGRVPYLYRHHIHGP